MIEPPSRLVKPRHLPDENWAAIEAEETRLHSAIEADDPAAVVGGIKCLVESVARVTMELVGSPVVSSAPFETTVNAAHNELKRQRGRDLTSNGEAGKLADWAKKMAGELGKVRNGFGTGHGRARLPEVTDEVVRLSVDGGMMWVRWVLDPRERVLRRPGRHSHRGDDRQRFLLPVRRLR